MIWRDDDIGHETSRYQLAATDDLFQQYRVTHTVAVIAQGLDQRPDLVRLIRERRINPQLHCWNHEDLTISAQARRNLPRAVDLMAQLFGEPPVVLYPPWNHSSPAVEDAAARLGLTVSTVKISLAQYVRCTGYVAEEVVNFHYWDHDDQQLLNQALAIYAQRRTDVKVTDYAPRAAPFDSYLRTRENLVGVEIGVDVGAHAEALLRYCPVRLLYLVDPWPRDYAYGYCEGRLHAQGYAHRVRPLRMLSIHAVKEFKDHTFDFIYIDQVQDGDVVTRDLHDWWPKLKVGGLLGHRNYAPVNAGLKDALDTFVRDHAITAQHEVSEIILVK